MKNYLSCEMSPSEADRISAAGLAHVGDAVYDLLFRTRLCTTGVGKAAELHRMTVAHVSAGAQAETVERLLPYLSEEEAAVYRRGRNVHVGNPPKNASVGEYARATGLEALFGYLFLTGQTDRINELFAIIVEEEEHAD